MSNTAEAPKGPYEATRTTTFEIAGPIKITIKHEDKASHPPQPCGCGGHGGGHGGGGLLEQILAALAQLFPQVVAAGDHNATQDAAQTD